MDVFSSYRRPVFPFRLLGGSFLRKKNRWIDGRVEQCLQILKAATDPVKKTLRYYLIVFLTVPQI